MVKLELHTDNAQWNVTKGGKVISTHATIGEAFAAKSALVRAATNATKRTKSEIRDERKQGGQRV